MDNRLRDLRREAEALLERINAAEVATPGLLRPIADIHERSMAQLKRGPLAAVPVPTAR